MTRTSKQLAIAVAAAVMAVLALSACGSEGRVPDVVGVALDDAHNELEDAGFEEFEDEDFFGDRAILRDANWVVLEQSPAGGDVADQGAEVQLRVGKIDESRTLERLPDGSPVLAASKEAEAERAKKKAAKAAKAAAASKPKPKRPPKGTITRAQYGDEWPFTVDTALLHCREPVDDRFGKVTVTLAGEEYALNGSARGSGDWLDFAESPLWRDDPDYADVKVSTARAISDGLDLCERP